MQAEHKEGTCVPVPGGWGWGEQITQRSAAPPAREECSSLRDTGSETEAAGATASLEPRPQQTPTSWILHEPLGRAGLGTVLARVRPAQQADAGDTGNKGRDALLPTHGPEPDPHPRQDLGLPSSHSRDPQGLQGVRGASRHLLCPHHPAPGEASRMCQNLQGPRARP